MANLEQLPSGSYRYTKQIDGRRIRVTFDHVPSDSEILIALAEKLKNVPVQAHSISDTLLTCCESYMRAKSNVLSPSTLKAYRSLIRAIPNELKVLPVDKIDQITLQQEVNRFSADHSPKTTTNYSSFLVSVIDMFVPGSNIKVTLPPKVKKDPYIPTTKDVKAVLDAIKGTEFEIPIRLSCYGLRRSEICALEVSDIKGDVVHINKALVQNERKEWVLNSTKTYESTRDIVIPKDLAQQIKDQGYVYKGHPGSITKHLVSVQKKLGIPRFTLHKMRHYFATTLSDMGVPEADILALGGWSTDRVMKSVYRHSRIDKDLQAKRNTIKKLTQKIK